jgi:hypothetical protein
LQWALYYLRCGLRVIRTNGKAPLDGAWQKSQASEADLRAWFGADAGFNIGIVTGECSRNLADLDLDIPAAVAVADTFLPKTGWVFGRPSHPRSHRFYRTDRIGETLKLKDPLTEKSDGEKAMLVELRGNGCQTVFPPSQHPSGEAITWDTDFTEPASANWNTLAICTYRIAIAALLARYWPNEGGRHEAAKALGGALARAGYPAEDAQKLIEAVTRAAGDPQPGDRVRAVVDSYRNHQSGTTVTGWPTLIEVFGAEKTPLIDRVHKWLDAIAKLTAAPATSQSTTAKGTDAKEWTLVVRRLDEVEPGPVTFLVEGLIPLGKVTLLGGCGGLGKSTATLDLTAAITCGRCAFGLNYSPPDAADVLLCYAEDDAQDTVVPRLLAAGADRTRVHEVVCKQDKNGKREPFSLADCVVLAATWEKMPTVRLIIIDPIGVFCGRTDVDTHKEAPVQALLAELRELALTYKVAIVLVGHLNKNEEQRAHHRISGSTAFVNAARAAFLFTIDETQEGRRLILPVKFNCGPKPAGLIYDIRALTEEERAGVRPALARLDEDGQNRLLDQLHRIEWKGVTEENADDVLARRRPGEPKDRERAAEWLQNFLAAKPIESDTCVADGNRALKLSHDRKWWRDAVLKPLLDGKPRRTRFGSGGKWYFTLPSHDWPFPGLDPEADAEASTNANEFRTALRREAPPPPIESIESIESVGVGGDSMPSPDRAHPKNPSAHPPDSLDSMDSMDSMGTTNPPIESIESIESGTDSMAGLAPAQPTHTFAPPAHTTTPPAHTSPGSVQAPNTEQHTIEGASSPAPDTPPPTPSVELEYLDLGDD